MGYFKINAVVPDNIMSSGQQVHKIYCRGNLIWEKEPEPTYPEVTIGTQTWMSVNLDIDDGLGGIYAYNDDESTVAAVGRFYTYDAAMRVAATVSGWRLPTIAEYQILVTFLGGSTVAGGKLKSTSDNWVLPNVGANNSSGFSAEPTGTYFPDLESYGIGEEVQYLSSTLDQIIGSNPWYYYLMLGNYSEKVFFGSERIPIAVRLIKDIPYEQATQVTIGTQTWMAVNLDIDDGGDGIYAYNNDENNVPVYGRLYTWDAAMRVAASIDGWHLPSDAEWTTLTTYLGGESVAGGKLKETFMTHWDSPNPGATNESGFTALPGGRRFYDGTFFDIGSYGYWWSATELDATDTWYYFIHYNNIFINRNTVSRDRAHSVRLIKDTP